MTIVLFAPRQQTPSFDDLVSACEDGGGQLQAKLSRRGLIDDELEFGRSLNRQFGWVGAAQDPIDVGCSAGNDLPDVHAV